VGIAEIGNNLTWKILSLDFNKSKVIIEFVVFNTSTMASATRLPVVGYTDWYRENIQKRVNDFLHLVPDPKKLKHLYGQKL
jgi:hypothetical protein